MNADGALTGADGAGRRADIVVAAGIVVLSWLLEDVPLRGKQ